MIKFRHYLGWSWESLYFNLHPNCCVLEGLEVKQTCTLTENLENRSGFSRKKGTLKRSHQSEMTTINIVGSSIWILFLLKKIANILPRVNSTKALAPLYRVLCFAAIILL